MSKMDNSKYVNERCIESDSVPITFVFRFFLNRRERTVTDEGLPYVFGGSIFVFVFCVLHRWKNRTLSLFIDVVVLISCLMTELFHRSV